MKGFLIITATHQEMWYEHIVTGGYVFVFIVSLVTNAFLFTVFFRNKSFRDLGTFLIVQMASSDVLYLSMTVVIVVVKNLELELSDVACKTLLYIAGVCRFASSFSLMLISLERSISVCSPTMCYSIRKITSVKKKAFLSVLFLALILRVGVLFVACDPEKWAAGYGLAVTSATYVLPLIVEMIAYVVAYHKIQQRIWNSTRSKHVLLFIRKSLRVFVIIAVVFAVCTVPTSVLVILQSFQVYKPSYFLGYLADMIECIPCVTNVICYLVCSPKFRTEIKKLVFATLKSRHEVEEPEGEDKEENDEVEPGKIKILDIHNTTLKLDWVLGDDPSQIEIPGSPPVTLQPVFDIPSTLVEEPEELGLGGDQEMKSVFIPKVSRKVPSGTWPRTRLQQMIDVRPDLELTNHETSATFKTDTDTVTFKSSLASGEVLTEASGRSCNAQSNQKTIRTSASEGL